VRVGSGDGRPWATVVGIVADERHNGVTSLVKEKFYVPQSQWHVVAAGNIVRYGFLAIRTTGDPMALAGPVRAAVRELDPNLPVANITPMIDIVRTALATPRLTGFLLSTFAAIALLLAAVGIYGVLAYLVSQRTHEIGIRLAVGADRGDVVRMVVWRGVVLAGIGAIVGVAGALALTRTISRLLYQVSPADPLTFAAVIAALLVTAALASAVPALRASRVDPLIALRAE
jgi:predicted lysophospholipase L1 biosynthesis ABC-type transport system permease subunit